MAYVLQEKIQSLIVRLYMLNIIKSGIKVAQHELDLVSNNLANSKTTGFKTSSGRFQDMYSSALDSSNTKGMGANFSSPIRIHKQGALIQTNGALDVSVIGNGMFVLGPPEGRATPYYTRDGSIMLDDKGNLLTSDGLPYLGRQANESGFNAVLQPINIPFSSTNNKGENLLVSNIKVLPSGIIEATYGVKTIKRIAQLSLARFSNPAELKQLGSNRFAETPISGPPLIGSGDDDGFGKLQAGSIESSNTDTTNELSKMIKAQQLFSGAARLLQSEVEMVRSLFK